MRVQQLVCLLSAMLSSQAGCANWFLLHPRTGRVGSSGERRLVPHNDGEIEIWISRARETDDPPDLYVLEFTGNAGRAEYARLCRPQVWPDVRAEVWRVNYPGFGGSTGPAGLRGIPPAALAAFDAIDKQAKGRPIIVCGNSLGTTAALLVASKRTVAGVIVKNPPPLQDLILRHYGKYALWVGAVVISIQVPVKLNVMVAARRTTAPAVFITSENDEIVPPKYQREVFDAYRGPKRQTILENAGHNASVPNAQLVPLLRWLLAQD